MKLFGLSRSTSACAAAGLFVFAQTVAFAQNALLRPPQAVITKTDAYLPGAVQMIASARTEKVVVHPKGRYALVEQNEAALPAGSFINEPTTGAAALLLYDARLRKVRTLWERRADGGKHLIDSVNWLPETDCAVVVTKDMPPPLGAPTGADSPAAQAGTPTRSVLFFDFTKSTVPRVLAASSGVFVEVSPTKPLFTMQDEEQIRMGMAPRGTFGPALPISPTSAAVYYLWNASGTSVYGVQHTQTQATPDSKPERVTQWYVWDGKTSAPTALKEQPTKAMIAPKVVPPPVLPLALRTGTFALPASVALPKKSASVPPTAILHPLYLEALSDPATAEANSYHSTLLAPDADKSYLLADQSAVLYQVGGALYAVPLVKVRYDIYAPVQKAAAMANVKQVGLAILGYTQDYDEKFPPQAGFPEVIGSYLKDETATQGFVFLSSGSRAAIASPATTIMGFIAAPGGRAVVYADGTVKWEAAP